uniref:Uncharacterized protein n=1 Tax=Anguilla anguilla TaxID=7936 RepID=A0A0E9TIH5_ANGAN
MKLIRISRNVFSFENATIQKNFSPLLIGILLTFVVI